MSTTATAPSPRYHDLDALRAFAMLLGIALHASLAFFPMAWPVQDAEQNGLFGLFFAAVHGFRMPVFFVMSGVFTAMLWRRRGLARLIEHRARRIVLPLLLGIVTIVPATDWVIRGVLMSTPAPAASESAPEISARAEIDAQDPITGATRLSMAVVTSQPELARTLLAEGANPSAANKDGSTPLHSAAFFGQPKMVELLLEAGADTDAVNAYGHTPLQVTRVDWKTTAYIAEMVNVEVERKTLEAGRARVVELLEAHDPSLVTEDESAGLVAALRPLMDRPVLHHLWFLNILCWLIAGFAALAWMAEKVGFGGLPSWFFFAPCRYAWLIALTLLPQLFMGLETPSFGPELSAGWLPKPHVLAFYAVFFGFGALFYDTLKTGRRVGRGWWLTLPLGLFVIFPLGLEFSLGVFGLRDALAPAQQQRLIAALLQAAYPWFMTFGLMGLFARLFQGSRPVMRYLSDASYWLYLAHLPLVIGAQALVRSWDAPAFAKFVLITGAVTLVLLALYQAGVRHTWIGRLLNGSRSVGADSREPRKPFAGRRFLSTGRERAS